VTTPEERHAVRVKRWAADRERLAEARRLVDLARPSRGKLRALTATCTLDHALIDVYRVNGVYVWEGTIESRQGDRWPDGSLGKLGKRIRTTVIDMLDADSTRGQLRQPEGSCHCGTFGAQADWLISQLERTDLPATRRVSMPWAVRPNPLR
jgi:hypothetical protein